MQITSIIGKAAWAALMMAPSQIHAAEVLDYSNWNLTLQFFEAGQRPACNYTADNATDVPSFTTSSIPIINHCFNIADLFEGNVSRGFVNQTRNLPFTQRDQEAGIHWRLVNPSLWNPEGNYSDILYRQHIPNAYNDAQKPGQYASRRVNIYGGENCTDTDPGVKYSFLHWFGFSCISEAEGSCGTTPYSIKSFTIMPGPEDDDDKNGKCMDFAELGAAGQGYSASRAVVGAGISVVLAVWLAL